MALLHVGLLYGGLSSEHDVSILSARNVFDALDRQRYRVTPLFIAPDGRWQVESEKATRLTDSADGARPAAFSPAEAGAEIGADGDALALDCIFPMLHGQNGEDGRIQGLLDTLGLPYVGPGVLGSAVCMDKEVAKRLLRDAGLPVVPFAVVRRGDSRPSYSVLSQQLGATLFVKPANSGSSVGVTRVAHADALDAALDAAFRYDHKVLVEQAVTTADGQPGREVECAVLGNEAPRASVPGEIVSTAVFYDYDAKYLDADAARMQVPAEIPDAVAERVRRMAVDAYRTLACEGMARVDFFVTGADAARDVFVNEVNTIPGFTARSMYPVMWEATGLPLPRLLDTLLDLAMERHARDAALATTR